jgi:hypothetical protein
VGEYKERQHTLPFLLTSGQRLWLVKVITWWGGGIRYTLLYKNNKELAKLF